MLHLKNLKKELMRIQKIWRVVVVTMIRLQPTMTKTAGFVGEMPTEEQLNFAAVED